MVKALFPGSFDPLTNGHLDIVKRASQLFDEVIIGVGTNLSKNYLFDADEKISLIKEATKDVSNTSVVKMHGLTVSFMQNVGADVLVRGLRNEKDYLYERDIMQMNMDLASVETIFLLAKPEHQFISSSLLKEIASTGTDISAYVPHAVKSAFDKKLGK
ncbi:pantetheine-phosphate adenylyltransferase [Weissella sagaensis]|jgi:pantetheine-phosphate adenylyltransferase|uniref:Phosphopantetheine adenylyltransferase n=1 Tax=Weissella sagaensis TaxID=2559928 RepID=A0ABW1RWI5_9LACO|nr:pantetheine-phosphate adenylyltransferase [Weissella sagaensis]KAA8433531.1 pantetheine-phosphate adenylyltransferase [Weissella paramesenteroides]MBU7568740.1 pantetheine-phosphate adenylyltransferase [Weissella hellenica]KAA8438650.1 pantetheine-phosphate adenylyltransferase [Weissella paramesenteroides]QDJ58950.1 pantetheine-phosphate adenylyltransferase [Weissella hellenica]QEA57946.1 pantetheine-phosphate adenylyltransferase [Weissella hellenica]